MSYMKFTTETSNLIGSNKNLTSAEAQIIVTEKWLVKNDLAGLVSYILTNWTAGNCVDYMCPIADKILGSKNFELHIKLWRTTVKRQEENFFQIYKQLKSRNFSYEEILAIPSKNFNEFRTESYTNIEKAGSFFLNRITDSLNLWALQVEGHSLKSESIYLILERLKELKHLKYDKIHYV